jgi:hypothetical protein
MPCARSLFQAIDGLLKMTEMMWASRILKSWRLPHEHLFLKNPIQKSMAGAQLIGCQWPCAHVWIVLVPRGMRLVCGLGNDEHNRGN